MKELRLSKRLTAAAGFCRKGSFICDVGTDHAYLPIYLCQKEIARGGIVSDINKGPIEIAEKNIKEAGMEKKLIPILCDGLTRLEGYSPEDIFILGMGGELIARIISDAPFVKNEGVRLILQPMTHPELLRKYLFDNGFEIIDEVLVKEDKIYQIILAEYSGVIGAYNQTELMLGKINIEKKDSLLFELLEHIKKVYLKRIEGKTSAKADATEEKNLLLEIEKLYEDNGNL